MIELNLTYEESKKILELGYNFSKVCIEFGNGNPTYVKVNDDLYLPTYSEIWGGTVHAGAFEGELPVGSISIIPKAALEECLPEIKESGWYASRNRIQLIYEDGCTDNCQTGIFYLHEMVIKEFDSAFEAFIWCHENYPKELKAKFDEVMG
jgi:hypothetical protein